MENFLHKFKECPYCHSKNVELEAETFIWLGGHQSGVINCKECFKNWFTTNDEKRSWQIPEEEENHENY